MSRVTAGIIHGTVNGYNSYGCRCPGCTRAAKRCDLRRKRSIARGEITHTKVDCTPAREHLEKLREQNVGLSTVQRSAGISTATYHRIMRVPGTTILGKTLEKILAVQADEALWIPAGGSRTRVGALAALGYSSTDVANRMGCNWPLTWASSAKMTRARVERIIRVAREIGDTPHPSPQPTTLARARRSGYLVPAYYEDEDFYENIFWDGTPPEMEEDMDRKLAVVEDSYEIERELREASNPQELHMNYELIAARLGLSWSYIVKCRKYVKQREVSKAWKQERRTQRAEDAA